MGNKRKIFREPSVPVSIMIMTAGGFAAVFVSGKIPELPRTYSTAASLWTAQDNSPAKVQNNGTAKEEQGSEQVKEPAEVLSLQTPEAKTDSESAEHISEKEMDESENTWVKDPLRSAVRLNTAFDYEKENEDLNSGPASSIAGSIYESLMEKDSSWMAEIYSLGSMSPHEIAERLGMDLNEVPETAKS